MVNDKEDVQKLFDEVSERTGMPRVDLSEDDSTAMPFGEDMLLHIHYRAEIPEVDFTVPLGSVPKRKKAAVYERLLSSNFYWIGTQGATLSYQDNLDEVILQFRYAGQRAGSQPVWWRLAKGDRPQRFPEELGIAPANILLLYE